MPEYKLKRVLGLPAVTFIAIGMTIGGGVFIFTGIVFNISGAGLPLAYLLAVVPVFISMLPLAMMGSAIPTVGGNYRYPSRMVSPGLAFVGIWVYALAAFFGQLPLYALGCAKYAQTIFPSLPTEGFAIGLITFFFVINLIGVKPAAQIQGVLVLILIAALLYYAFSGLPAIASISTMKFLDKGWGSLFIGTALLTFTYFGSNAIIEMGGEIVNPGKTIPRAFAIAFPVVAIIYIAVAVTTVANLPAGEARQVDEPLIATGRIILSENGLVFFIIGGAILALITTLNAMFLVGTRSILIIIEDELLPKGLGRIHSRFGTPWVLLLFLWIFSSAGILSGLSLQTLASYAALGGLIIFFPTMLAALRFPALYPEQYRDADFKLKGFWLWACPIVGILMVLFFSLVIMIDLKTRFNIGCFLFFIVSGVIFYQWRKRSLIKRGIDLSKKIVENERWID
jgi:APA family basic amino acid/polyamine antiporter